MKLEDRALVIASEAQAAIRQLSKKNRRFDFIFLDPPYEKGLGQDALNALAGSTLLLDGAWVVLECRAKEEAIRQIGDLLARMVRDYGDTRIVLYQKEEK